MKEKKKGNVITLPENVTIDMGDREILLEKGDKIRVVTENSDDAMRQLKSIFVRWSEKEIIANAEKSYEMAKRDFEMSGATKENFEDLADGVIYFYTQDKGQRPNLEDVPFSNEFADVGRAIKTILGSQVAVGSRVEFSDLTTGTKLLMRNGQIRYIDVEPEHDRDSFWVVAEPGDTSGWPAKMVDVKKVLD